MTKNKTMLVASLASIILISGCTTTPTVGDKMIMQSSNTKELGTQWKNGKSFVSKGEAKKSEGQKLIQAGNDKVAEGEAMVQRGQRMMSESELIYKERFPNGVIQ